MRFLGTIAAWTATLFLTSPAFAWNATGHRIIAAIAYDRLTPEVRARVDQLLRKHPDYSHLARNASEDPAKRARAVFVAAAVWPDDIKGDPRFWDDTYADAQPTQLLPGFPDMKRHTNWHYYDTPYAPDGAHTTRQPPPSALTELPRLLKELGQESDAAADLRHRVDRAHRRRRSSAAPLHRPLFEIRPT